MEKTIKPKALLKILDIVKEYVSEWEAVEIHDRILRALMDMPDRPNITTLKGIKNR